MLPADGKRLNRASEPRSVREAENLPSKTEASKIVVENVNVPGYRSNVDAAPYEAMKKVLLKILPTRGPGLTQAEMVVKAAAIASPTLFPERGKVQWWVKCVHLDLEAKGVVARDTRAKPTRWRRVK
jgi:hypothetical protein